MPDKQQIDGEVAEDGDANRATENEASQKADSPLISGEPSEHDNPETSLGNENQAPASDENKTDKKDDESEEIDVLGNGKLLKKVISPGKSPRPIMGDQITVTFSTYLEDQTEVEKQDTLKFVLGDGDYIQAFDLCCALMDVDEKARITTDATYAYGEAGRNPDIPPNATLIYEVHLETNHGPVDYQSMPIVDRIADADKKRERGNYYYSRTEYAGAINSYTKALAILDDSGQSHSEGASALQKLVDMRVKCFNNLAAAQLKIEVYEAAVRSCDSVLAVQPENVKALFRKGKCLAAQGDTKDAIIALKKALKTEPESKIIHNELSRLTSRAKIQEERERAMYQRMMGQDTKSSESDQKWKVPGWMWAAGSAGAAVLVSLGITAYKYYHHV